MIQWKGQLSSGLEILNNELGKPEKKTKGSHVDVKFRVKFFLNLVRTNINLGRCRLKSISFFYINLKKIRSSSRY